MDVWSERPVGADGVQVLDHEPGQFCYSLWRNIPIIVWLAPATDDTATRAVRAGQRAARQHPEGRSSVSFVAAGIASPSDSARRILSQGFDRKRTEIRTMVIVLEGDGFWASRVRASITNMKLSVAEGSSTRICTSIDEVAGWLPEVHQQATGVRVMPAELASTLQAVRSRCQ